MLKFFDRVYPLVVAAASLGGAAMILFPIISVMASCRASEFAPNALGARLAAPIVATIPGIVLSFVAVSEVWFDGVKQRIDQIAPDAKAVHDVAIAAGNKLAPEPRMSWEQWLYVLTGPGGAATGTEKFAARNATAKVKQLRTGAATAMAAVKNGTNDGTKRQRRRPRATARSFMTMCPSSHPSNARGRRATERSAGSDPLMKTTAVR